MAVPWIRSPAMAGARIQTPVMVGARIQTPVTVGARIQTPTWLYPGSPSWLEELELESGPRHGWSQNLDPRNVRDLDEH